jgi:hypothetical protein
VAALEAEKQKSEMQREAFTQQTRKVIHAMFYISGSFA